MSFSDLTTAKVTLGFLLQPRLACCVICVSTRVLLANEPNNAEISCSSIGRAARDGGEGEMAGDPNFL